jgi:Tfp pilus assembly protein PilX
MRGRSVSREDGWVLVSAIVLMAIMLSVGLSAFAFVDTGQKRSRESRERESALSLAEGALYAQGFALTRNWPNPGQPLGGDCSSTMAISSTTLYCPDRDTLAAGSSGNVAVAQFAATDFKANAAWTTKVRDNSGVLSAAYSTEPLAGTTTPLSDTTLVDPVRGACPQTPCRMDWNQDRQLWVESRVMLRGRARNIVARLKLEELPESVPTAGVVSGGINVSNNGNKLMIDADGTQVLVRCSPVNSTSCTSYRNGQITPLPQSVATQPNFMTPAQLERFKQRAITDGKYFAGCPPTGSDLSGTVVWVEACAQSQFSNQLVTTPCTPPSGMSTDCINTLDKPGMLIFHCGVMDWQGGITFRGILYNANNSDGTCAYPPRSGNCSQASSAAVVTNGGFGVWGALVVDGGGCIEVGSNGLQIKYDSNVFNAVSSYGTVGLVQNTWRELKGR